MSCRSNAIVLAVSLELVMPLLSKPVLWAERLLSFLTNGKLLSVTNDSVGVSITTYSRALPRHDFRFRAGTPEQYTGWKAVVARIFGCRPFEASGGSVKLSSTQTHESLRCHMLVSNQCRFKSVTAPATQVMEFTEGPQYRDAIAAPS